MEGKNVYQKIQSIRVQLQDLNLKKTGKNTYSGFTYYELCDFLPQLNKLNNDVGLMTKFYLTTNPEVKETAVLEVFNAEKPEESVLFQIPTAEVEIGKKKDGTGGADPIQNLGGKVTYLRRYLMMTAFEIIESDYIDKSKQENQSPLDEVSLKKINEAKTVEDLIIICNKIKAEKGNKYHKSLIACYTARKLELEKIKEIVK